MRVQFTPYALRETRVHEVLVRFVLGGIITAFAGIIAQRFGPILAGLFLAFPAIFPASASLVEKHERKQKEEKGLHGARRGRQAASADAAGASIGSIGLLVFACAVWQLLPSHSAVGVITLATLAWALVSVAGWQIRKRV
jgi:hypothetical protein